MDLSAIILCSDGLTDLVDKEEIRYALRSHSRDKALQALTQLANERGGHDNITIVLLEVPGKDVITQVSQVRHRAPQHWFIFIFLLLGLAFIIIDSQRSVASGLTNPAATPTYFQPYHNPP
jgi:hypothetical protein